MNDNKQERGFKKLKSGRLLEIMVVVIIVVIVAIVLYNFLTKRDDGGENVSADYETALEAQLGAVLSDIEGAGEVSVMISFSDEGETVIATETKVLEDGTVVTAPVLVDGEVVVLEVKKPEISGVLIVAEGADDLSVRFDLLSAAASVLDINQSLIKVYARG
ncbi:MAG TPA: hypothetical protein H9708_06035 [Candidatus Borkfalkia stercoripullorum]|nr:hypothetical protein [Candidatus Borkfalkia stercoripullorum]